jgi:hypothetical protein
VFGLRAINVEALCRWRLSVNKKDPDAFNRGLFLGTYKYSAKRIYDFEAGQNF